MLKEYKQIISVLTFLFLCTAAMGQTLTPLNGAVLEKGSNKRIAEAKVYNLRTSRTVSTSNAGLFSMPSSEGDTLQVTHPDYSGKEFIVVGFSDIIIYLQSSNTQQKALLKANRKLSKPTNAETDEKEINSRFSDVVIKANTGLKADALSAFKKAYRPNIEELRNWSDYDLYNYIKKSFAEFQQKKNTQ